MIEYWTNKYSEETIDSYYEKACKEMKENKNYNLFFFTVNVILKSLKGKYPKEFSSRSYLNPNENSTCNSIVNIKGIENFLNKCYKSQKFSSFEVNFANKPLENIINNFEIYLTKINDKTAFDITSRTIEENKCPLLAALPIKRTDIYSVKELKQSVATTAREIKSNYCSVSLHSFLITGIDSQSGKIRLINPTPRKRSEGIIELSKDEFNKYCFILSGILGKEFSL